MGQASFPPDENHTEGFTEIFDTTTLDEMAQKLRDALERGASKVEAWPLPTEEKQCPQ